MALRETSIPIRFQGGLETKADPKSVTPARLLTLQNAVFTKGLSLSKRLGYSSLGISVLGSATGYGETRGLGVRGSELVLFGEGTSYSYVEEAEAWSEIPDGVMSLRQSDKALVKTISNQTACDYAAVGNIALVAWEDSRGGVWCAVVESDGGRVTYAPAQASATGQQPRCVRSGDNLILVWAEAALGQLKRIVFDSTQPHTLGSNAQVLVDDLVTSLPNFDAAYVPPLGTPTSGAAAIAWNATSGIRVAWLMPSGAIGTVGQGYASPLTVATTAAVTAGPALAVNSKGFDAALWDIAWATASKVYYDDPFSIADPSDPITHTGAVEIDVAGVDRLALARRRLSGGDIVEIWLEERATPVRNSRVTRVTYESAVATTRQTIRGVTLASTAWTDRRVTFDDPEDFENHVYVNLLHPLPLQSTYLSVREDGLVVAQSTPGNCGDAPGHQLPRVIDDDDRVYQWCGVYKGKLDAINDDVFTESGPRLVSLDFGATDAYQTAYLGRTLYLGGAVTMAYDGISWVEAGFHYAPDWESGAVLHTSSTAGTGGMANGTYNYIAWYEATLANGEIIRGPVSKPYQVTVSGSDDRVTLTIPSCRATAWGRGGREHCRVCVARSLDGDASIYYRITSLDPSTEGDPNGYVSNTTSADTVEVIDELSDADLALNEPHYTTGGVPSNDAIATSGVIAEGDGRLFVGASSDPNVAYFSHERADGFTAEMSPDLRIVLPPEGGSLTGIAVMDGSKIMLKRGSVYRVDGAGPAPGQAVAEGWTPPVRITSDVGCLDQRTIATSPIGLVFQSAKGIYQLDRGGQVGYIGAPVERFNAQRITRATLIDDTTQIRFLTDDGQSLLFDYLFGQWSTFTQHEGLDSAIVGGVYHYLRTDGRVFKQAATYADDNLQIPMVIETAWIRLGEARQGFQRIWHAQILGTWLSAHTLRVQVKTDYDESDNWSDPVAFAASSMGGDNYGDGNYGDGDYGGDSPSIYEFTMHVGRKCESIQFRFTFIEDADSAGACAELTELLITGGVKGSRNKLPAERMG